MAEYDVSGAGPRPPRRESAVRSGCVLIAAVAGIAVVLLGVFALGYARLRDDAGDEAKDPATTIQALDAANGVHRWERRVSNRGENVELHLTGSSLVYATSRSVIARDLATGAARWRRSLSVADIAVGEDTVFVVDRRGRVSSWDAATGATRWSMSSEMEQGLNIVGNTVPLVTGAFVVVLADEGSTMHALDATSGVLVSSVRLGADHGIPVASAGVLFVRDGSGTVTATDLATGAVVWSASYPDTGILREEFGELASTFLPLIAGGPVLGVTVLDADDSTEFIPSSMVFVDVATGSERWRTSSGFSSSFSFVATETGGVLVEYGESGEVVARDPATGAVRWSFETTGSVSLVPSNGAVLVSGDRTRNAGIEARNGSTGVPIWRRHLDSPATDVEAGSQTVLVGTSEP